MPQVVLGCHDCVDDVIDVDSRVRDRSRQRDVLRVTTALEARPREASITGWNVLVLDDDAEVREAIRTLHEELGCNVMLAGDPREALTAAAGQRPQLVLADLRLRDHQSGIDAVGQIRAKCRNVPALLVTGDIAADRLREVAASGLPRRSKPLTEHELLAGIVEAVERCPMAPAEALC